MPSFAGLGAANVVGQSVASGGLSSFLSSAPSFLGGGGGMPIPGLTGGDAESGAFSSSSGTLSSPFIFGGSGAGVDQNGGLFKWAIVAGAILLGVLIWKRA